MRQKADQDAKSEEVSEHSVAELNAKITSLEKIQTLLEQKSRLQQANFDKQSNQVAQLLAELQKNIADLDAKERLIGEMEKETADVRAKTTADLAQ